MPVDGGGARFKQYVEFMMLSFYFRVCLRVCASLACLAPSFLSAARPHAANRFYPAGFCHHTFNRANTHPPTHTFFSCFSYVDGTNSYTIGLPAEIGYDIPVSVPDSTPPGKRWRVGVTAPFLVCISPPTPALPGYVLSFSRPHEGRPW